MTDRERIDFLEKALPIWQMGKAGPPFVPVWIESDWFSATGGTTLREAIDNAYKEARRNWPERF